MPAQSVGGINGRVTDPGDAVIPVATVTAKEISTGLVRHTSTSGLGSYFFTLLPIGTYEIAANAQGFVPSALRVAAFALAGAAVPALFSEDRPPSVIRNSEISVSLVARPDSYSLRVAGSETPVLNAIVGAQVDHRWLKSSDYPHADTTETAFHEALGSGSQLITTFTGLAGQPELVRTLRVYDRRPFGDVAVTVRNSTGKPITIQAIRVVDAIGSPMIDLGGPEPEDRVLSDSFSEDRPVMRIADLGNAPVYRGFSPQAGLSTDLHRAVGLQLVYNRRSGRSILLAALTSERWLTIFHLQAAKGAQGAAVHSWTADCTGTTEVARAESLLRNATPEDQLELSLPVGTGGELASERLLFTAGDDYHARLENYGTAVKELHHARVDTPAPQGWWSWITFLGGITDQAVLTNAQWLACNVKNLGYHYILIDEGYQYARGEYITANATQFPDGIHAVTQRISELGLKPGIWTAPFEISERAWVYEHHKDWLVCNASGTPIRFVPPSFEPIYVLDTTHPGAQEYLRLTYRTLTRDWGIKYIKLDFMDDTAVEGFYYRPNTTALEAQRIGLQVIRDAVGEQVLLDKDGSPMLNPVGIVDEGRVSTDTDHTFTGSKRAATGIAARYYMHRNFFINDPDAFSITRRAAGPSDPLLSLPEAEVAIVLSAVSGSMFDVGGDTTMLTSEPERLALLRNPDLLQMVGLSRAALPLDLMSYAPEDEQPSIFLLREDGRQSMLAVFNWSDSPRSHLFALKALGLPGSGKVHAADALHPDAAVNLAGGTLELRDQAPHSVRLIRLTDEDVAAAAPSVHADIPGSAEVGKPIQVAAISDNSGIPVVAYRWNFGDGISEDGARATHAYAIPGSYTVTLTAMGVDGLSATQSATIAVGGSIDGHFHLEKNRRYSERRDE